jgi:hypothetical protein
MLLWTGALLSCFLGYRLHGWWVPAAMAVAVLAAQALAYQGVLSGQRGLAEFLALIGLSGLMSLVMFYATFSIGHAFGLRRRRRRKGAP